LLWRVRARVEEESQGGQEDREHASPDADGHHQQAVAREEALIENLLSEPDEAG
jgi:hypothetical protein